MNNNILGRNIRKARLKKGWTQKQLAEAIGVKHNSISDWENGKNEIRLEIVCTPKGVPWVRIPPSPPVTRVSGFVLKPYFCFWVLGL